MKGVHDCFGSVVKSEKGALTFLCGECGRPFAVLDKEGLTVASRHGKGKDVNRVGMRALKQMIKAVEAGD